jgi:ABC-type nickel/cobalt efflux system permease component RcnA
LPRDVPVWPAHAAHVPNAPFSTYIHTHEHTHTHTDGDTMRDDTLMDLLMAKDDDNNRTRGNTNLNVPFDPCPPAICFLLIVFLFLFWVHSRQELIILLKPHANDLYQCFCFKIKLVVTSSK